MTYRRLPAHKGQRFAVLFILLATVLGAHAAPNSAATPPTVAADANIETESDTAASSVTATPPTLQQTLQPSNQTLAATNQELLRRNATLQRQVTDLQTQVNVLIYESKGQLFLYGALTTLVSIAIGALISWLILSRRTRW